MKQVLHNPFRTLGVGVTASSREIEKAISNLEIFAEIGKVKEYWYDNLKDDSIDRSSEQITAAANILERPSSKLLYSLFWFWEGTDDPVDEMAFDQLKSGNIQKAADFWEKGISTSTVEKSPSYWKNISSLYLFLSDKYGEKKSKYILAGLRYMGPFLDSLPHTNYIEVVTGGGNSYDLRQVVADYTNYLADELSNVIEMDNVENFQASLKAVRGFPRESRNIFIEKYTKKRVRHVESLVAEHDERVDIKEHKAISYGLELYKDTKDDILILTDLVKMGEIQYQPILDNFYNILIQDSISSWNENEIDEESKIYRKILKTEGIVKSSSASNAVLDRAEEQYGVMHDIIGREQKFKPLIPLGQMLGKAQELSDKADKSQQYEIGKRFVFSIKRELDKVRQLYIDSNDTEQQEIIENVIVNCSMFVNQCGVITANGYQEYGRAIELVDMASRILLYKNGYSTVSINQEISNGLISGRRTLSNNTSNAKGLLGLALGGGIRAIKKNIKCGCGSGKALNECCSV